MLNCVFWSVWADRTRLGVSGGKTDRVIDSRGERTIFLYYWNQIWKANNDIFGKHNGGRKSISFRDWKKGFNVSHNHEKGREISKLFVKVFSQKKNYVVSSRNNNQYRQLFRSVWLNYRALCDKRPFREYLITKLSYIRVSHPQDQGKGLNYQSESFPPYAILKIPTGIKFQGSKLTPTIIKHVSFSNWSAFTNQPFKSASRVINCTVSILK